MSLSRLQYITISYLLLLPVIVNLFAWQLNSLSLFFGGIFVIFESLVLGELLSNKKSLLEKLFHGVFFFLLLLLLTSSIFYLFFNLANPAVALLFLLLPIITLLLQKYTAQTFQRTLEIHETRWEDFFLPKRILLLLIAYILLFIGNVWILLTASTTAAITSPWTELTPVFWIYFFLSTILLFLISWFSESKWLSPLLTVAHLLLCFSIGLFIYKLGYGFDPFIHQATERLILTEGVVTPKTPYYIGQYALLVTLHKLIGVPLLWLDRLLVPVLASTILPLLFSTILPRKKAFARFSLTWMSLSLLFLPFSSFVVTTPQGLANILFLCIIVAAFSLLSHQDDAYPLFVLWFIGIAAVFTHPLTGVPAIIFLLLLTLDLTKDRLSFPKWLQKSFYIETILIGSISIPLLFLLNTLLSPNFTTSLRIPAFSSLGSLLAWWPLSSVPQPNTFKSLFFEFGYFIQNNVYWIFTSMILAVIYWFATRKKQGLIRPYLFTSCIFIINALILSIFLEFPELIQYESFDYARRLFDLALLTLLPLVALGIVWVVQKARSTSLLFVFLLSIGLSWLVTGNLFASYPRDNTYEISRQYNTSLTDYRTVNRINSLAKNDFVVLADQTVSAAAIAEFGFKHYHSGPEKQPIFYYPVPTSSPLYQIFLDMNANPTKKTAELARQLVDVEEVFFVVNEYWNNANQITEIAKGNSDNWFEIDNGKATVFVYRFGED
jgi:hypothetical protein